MDTDFGGGGHVAGNGAEKVTRDLQALEDDDTVVRCLSTLKIYWYDPK